MYTCANCETTYDLVEEHVEYIGVECNKNGIVTSLVLCPTCNNIHIVGGESDWDEVEGRSIINMFGYDFRHHRNTSLLKMGLMAFRGKKVE